MSMACTEVEGLSFSQTIVLIPDKDVALIQAGRI